MVMGELDIYLRIFFEIYIFLFIFRYLSVKIKVIMLVYKMVSVVIFLYNLEKLKGENKFCFKWFL